MDITCLPKNLMSWLSWCQPSAVLAVHLRWQVQWRGGTTPSSELKPSTSEDLGHSKPQAGGLALRHAKRRSSRRWEPGPAGPILDEMAILPITKSILKVNHLWTDSYYEGDDSGYFLSCSCYEILAGNQWLLHYINPSLFSEKEGLGGTAPSSTTSRLSCSIAGVFWAWPTVAGSAPRGSSAPDRCWLGAVSSGSSGSKDTNGSQFFILFKPAHHLNGARHRKYRNHLKLWKELKRK